MDVKFEEKKNTSQRLVGWLLGWLGLLVPIEPRNPYLSYFLVTRGVCKNVKHIKPSGNRCNS